MQRLYAQKPTARVLLVSVRIIHALDLAAALQTTGVQPALYTDYRGNERDLVREQCVVLSMEQCMHLQLGHVQWDLVVLDEVRSLADKFGISTTLSAASSVTQLQRAYARARYCIAADADCSLDNAVTYLLDGMASRPVNTLRVTHKRLHRTLCCTFDGKAVQRVPDAFVDAVAGIGRGEPRRLGVVCATKTMAQRYAAVCKEAGVAYVLYHGGVSGAKKTADFANPDVAWKDKQVVIYNTCVTVGVDPKTTVFDKIFLHTSRLAGSLRDLFQGVCRLGRRPELLLDTRIHCVVHCRDPRLARAQAERDGGPAAEVQFSTVMKGVRRQKQAALGAAASDLESCLLPTAPVAAMDGWFDRVRAAVRRTDGAP